MTMIPALLLQSDTDLGAAGVGGLMAVLGSMMLVFCAVAVLFIIGGWKVFTKAGKPGWAILIPIYNAYVVLTIVGRPGWWLLLMFIPLVNIAIALIVAIDMAKSFGQTTLFGVLVLFILGAIGYLVLGFGNYKYLGPAAATAA